MNKRNGSMSSKVSANKTDNKPDDLRGKYMTVKEMGDLLGLKKTERYWLIKKNYFQTKIIAGQMRVYIPSFEEWYADQVRYRKVAGEEPGIKLKAKSYSAKDVMQILNISEFCAYELLNKVTFEFEIVDGTRRIPEDVFWKWYKTQDKYYTTEDAAKQSRAKEASISMPEMAKLLNIDRNVVYEILRDKQAGMLLKTVNVMGQKRITKESFETWYGKQEKYSLKTAGERSGISQEPDKRITAHRLNRKERNLSDHDGNLHYLTRKEAAIFADVTPSMIGHWYLHGKFPARKLGDEIWIPRDEFECFLVKRNQKSPADIAG